MIFIGILTLIETLFVMAAFVLGGAPVIEAFFTALLISSPIIASCGLIYAFKSRNGKPASLLYWPTIGAYAVNLGIGVYFLYFYMPGILSNRDLGPAEGYWFLFVLGTAYQYLWIGVLAGASVPAAHYISRRNS